VLPGHARVLWYTPPLHHHHHDHRLVLWRVRSLTCAQRASRSTWRRVCSSL
jgi:hypothetical protein